MGSLLRGRRAGALRRLVVAAIATAVAWVLVSTASASSPAAGGHFVRFQAAPPGLLFIDAAYTGPRIFDPWHHTRPLTALGCSFTPENPASEAATARVVLRVYGWTSGDLYNPRTGVFAGQRDALHAQLTGSVLDAAQQPYTLTGSFFDDGSRHVLAGQDFYGIGQVTISNAAHRVAGSAILYRVSEGDDSWSIDFTHLDTCT